MKIDWRTATGCAGMLAGFAVLMLLARWGLRGGDAPRPEHQAVARELSLHSFQQVRESSVFRATLTDRSGGYSGYGRARNVLFIEDSGESRWLLPDDDHVLEEHDIPSPQDSEGEKAAPIAMAVLARPAGGEVKPGELYLSDPNGRRVERVAEGVRALHAAALAGDGLVVLYEGAGGYVLAHHHRSDFRTLREVKVPVPALK